MTGPDVRSDDAADFLDYAAARQGPALRVATLVTGRRDLGEEVALEALTRLASLWSSAREEGPDRMLRGRVLRAAVTAAEEHERVRTRSGAPAADRTPSPEREPSPWGVDGPLALHDVDEEREAVREALAGLPPRVRALAVAHWLEERDRAEVARLLGVTPGVVAAELDLARGALTRASHRATSSGGAVDDDEARALLELVADDVGEVDLAGPAWDAALARRRTVRRRAVVGGGLVAAGGVAAVVLGGGGHGSRPLPRPTPSPSPTDGRMPMALVAGATVHLAPEPVDEPSLPSYTDSVRVALPRRFGPDPRRGLPIEPLSPAGTDASVRAVYLVEVRRDRFQPVLFLPRDDPRHQIVPMTPLRPLRGVEGQTALRLGPRTIDQDRHRLVFPQPGAVVVLEVRSARTRRIAVPDENLTSAGWASDGITVVATSARSRWLVDSRTGEVRPTVVDVNAGWAAILVDDRRPQLVSYTGDGRVAETRSIEGPDLDVIGDTISNIEGWACRGALFGAVPATGNRIQGLLAVQDDLTPSPRILAAPVTDQAPFVAYRPLGWGPRDTVLLESRSLVDGHRTSRVLAWDVVGDRLSYVGVLEWPDSPQAGGFTGAWAI